MRSPTDTFSRCSRAAAAALLTLTLAACGDDLPPSPLTIGSVVMARSQIDTTDPKATVLLPVGKLVVRSGEPVQSLTAEQTVEHTAQVAPEGGSFVPLRLTGYADLFRPLRPVFGAPKPLRVDLIADGERFAVTAPRMDVSEQDATDMYVAVPGVPEELELEIAYAGVEQTVDLATGDVLSRRAALLERTAEHDLEESTECSSEDWTDVPEGTVVAFGCKHTRPIVTPFLDGKFAREGFAFVVVRIDANLASLTMYDADGGQAIFHVRKSKDHTRLGEIRPIKTIGEESAKGYTAGFYAWRIELDDKGRPKFPGTLHFKRKYLLDLNSVKGDIDPDSRRLLTVDGDIKL